LSESELESGELDLELEVRLKSVKRDLCGSFKDLLFVDSDESTKSSILIVFSNLLFLVERDFMRSKNPVIGAESREFSTEPIGVADVEVVSPLDVFPAVTEDFFFFLF